MTTLISTFKPEGSLGGVSGAHNLGANDNTDDYHVFRVASMDGGLFQAWRDGVLVGENLAHGGSWSGDWFDFGDIGGGNAGECLVDYVRFTPGAFAPTGGEQPSLPPVKPERPGAVAGGPVIDGGTTPYAWYRADQGVVPYINATERVAWWTDQSGNSRHVESFADPEITTGGNEGRTVIHFDEIGDMM